MAQKRSELVLVMPPPLPSTCISAAPPQQPRSSPQSRSLLEHTCQRVVAAGRVRTRVHPGLRRRAGWRRRARGHRCSHVIMARELTPSPALPVLVSRMYLDSPLAPRSCPFSHLARPVAPLAPAALRPCGPAAQRPCGPAALRPCGPAAHRKCKCDAPPPRASLLPPSGLLLWEEEHYPQRPPSSPYHPCSDDRSQAAADEEAACAGTLKPLTSAPHATCHMHAHARPLSGGTRAGYTRPGRRGPP